MGGKSYICVTGGLWEHDWDSQEWHVSALVWQLSCHEYRLGHKIVADIEGQCIASDVW